MSKPPSKVKRAPLVPDVDLLYQHLWRQYINQPGVFQKLMGHLEAVKKEDDDTISDLEFPSSEDDFHPLSESSRISVSESSTATGRLSLPPMSPRTPAGPSQGDEKEEGNVFFMAKNIDLVPDRNISSPVVTVEDTVNVSAIKVPVIRYFPPVEVLAVVVKEPVENETESKKFSTNSSITSQNIQSLKSTPSQLSQMQEIPSIVPVPPFYPPNLPTPLLSPSFISYIQSFFSSQPSSLVTTSTAPLLAQTLEISSFLSHSLFTSSFGAAAQSGSCSQFLSFWQANAKLLHQVKDSVRMFHLLSGCTRDYLVPEDFIPIAKTVLETHKQLDFFRDASYHNLHDSYLTSVVTAIFFTAGAWRRKKMFFWQFAKLDFEQTLVKLSDEEMDLNFIDYFSYDQFYVFYLKFVSLDMDEDGELSKNELLEYEEGGQLARKVVDRVWQVNLFNKDKNMDFWDWVIFVMAEVDKTTDPAMDYWFAVLDTDADGLLSLVEMKDFYSESLMLLITADINVPHFVHWNDITVQICDILKSRREGLFSLMDIKGNCKFAHILDAFVNIFNFIMNDENDVSIKSDLSILQKYVVRSLNDLES